MSDVQKRQELEQLMAMVADDYPPYIRRMCVNLIEAGFEKSEALRLIEAYMHGMAGGKWC